ncbi:hypothetical protein ABZ806_42595 [Spirillospora sp. NPDC047418]
MSAPSLRPETSRACATDAIHTAADGIPATTTSRSPRALMTHLPASTAHATSPWNSTGRTPAR